MGGRESSRPPIPGDANAMGYYYLPGGNHGDPMRALKLLVKFLLWASLIGFIVLLVRKITGKIP